MHQIELEMQNEELRNTQLALEESRNLYQQLYEFAPIGYLTLSPAALITDINLTGALMLGEERTHILNRPFARFVAAGDSDNWHRFFQRSLSDGDQHTCELLLQHGDSPPRHARLDLRPMDGDFQRTCLTLVDITERRQYEEALRQAKEQAEVNVKYLTLSENHVHTLLDRYQTILATTQDGFWMIDPKGEIKDVNEAYCRMSGYSRDELLTMSVADLEANESPKEVHAHITDVIRSCQGLFTTCHRKKNGDIFSVEVSVSFVVFDHGTFLCAFIRDITERIALEKRLAQKNKMEAIGVLAGGVAHDFNNILAIILANTELIALRPEILLTSLRQIHDATMRGRDLVKQLLTFGRRSSTSKVRINPIPVVKDVLRFMRSTLPSSIVIRERFHPDELHVMADPTLLYQIVMNLCTNAGHVMGEEGGVLTVALERIVVDPALGQSLGLTPAAHVMIMVQDTGPGIPPEILPHIFEPFFTTKNDKKGSGLGLSVVHGALANCGGGIQVESQPDQGAKFRIYLPEMVNTTPGGATPEANAALTSGSGTILFVDDEPELVKVTQEMLTYLGYKVFAFTDPQQALDTFLETPELFTAVITDQIMPNLCGDMLAARIHEKRPDLPVFLCTGYSEKMNKESAGQAGIAGFFLKPVSFAELSRVLKNKSQPSRVE